MKESLKKVKYLVQLWKTSGEINEVTSFQGLAIFLAAGRKELLSAASLSA